MPLPMIALAALLMAALVLWRPVTPLVLLGLLAPIGMTQLPASLDVVTVLSGLVVVAAAWEALIGRASLLPTSAAALAASIWTLGVLGSVAFSDDLARAAVLGTWQILAAWTAIGISVLARTEQRMQVSVAAVLLGASIVAGSGVIDGVSSRGAFNGSVVEGRAIGVFSQPNEYGLYTAMLWAFSLVLACLVHSWLKWLAALCSVLSLAGLAASFSRGAWMGAALAAVVMAILVPQTRRPQTIGLAIGLGMLSAALVIVPFWQLPRLLLDRVLSVFAGGTNPYDNRPALMAEGLREWQENLLFGVGPNMYPVQSRSLASETRTLEGQHAHNLVLTVGAEQGIVGLVALGVFVAAVVVAFSSARRFALGRHGADTHRVPLGAAVTMSAAAALVALVGAGVVDYPLRNALTRTTAWMFIGLALAGHRSLRYRQDNQQARSIPEPVH